MISLFKKPKQPHEPEPKKINFVPDFEIKYDMDNGFYVSIPKESTVLLPHGILIDPPEEDLEYFETESDAMEAVYRLACKNHQEYMINKRLKQQW